jgi:RND family efflux transporter MFP subunit
MNSPTTPEPNSPSRLHNTFSMKNLIFVGAVLAAAGGGFYALWLHHKPEETYKEVSNQVLSVPTVQVTAKTLFREDQLPGEIDAYQDVLIYPKVPGFVKEISVDRGSVVKKGQFMVRMYAPEYMSRRNQALAQVAAAKAALAAEESRLEDLKADLKKKEADLLADQSTYQRVYAASLVPGVIADNDVVHWSQSVESDRQEVNTAIKRVNAKDHEVSMKRQEVEAMIKGFENYADFASYLVINAPFDGYVTDRKMHVGSFVGPDGTGAYPPICRVKQLDLLRIIAPVPEEDAAGVVVGAPVQFTVSSFPGQRFTGTVARISNDLDKGTRTMPVELNFNNPTYKILPGMFCKVYWPTRRETKSLFVPDSAVVSTPLNTFVCKVSNDRIEWVSVKKGQSMDGMIEVFGNLHEGDIVAQQGSEELQNQSTVHPVGTKGLKAAAPADLRLGSLASNR